MALALCALACACSQPNDAVANVQLLSDGGLNAMTGSGGAVGAGMQNPASQCMLPEWYGRASMIDLKEVACRSPKGDPLVAWAERFYQEQRSRLPPVMEGQTPTKCDFNWPSPYYEDPAYPDTYTFCPVWCGLIRYAAVQALMDYQNCMKGAQMSQAP